jgi:hypothetical protein
MDETRLNQEISSLQMDFPSNSDRSHERVNTEIKPDRKTQGTVIKRKKSLGKKLSETFLGENLSSVLSYVMYDVLIPAAKNTLDDMVSGGIHRLLFSGGSDPYGHRERGRDRGRPYVSYDRLSDRDRDVDRSARNRAKHNMSDIRINTRREAEDVLYELQGRIHEYGFVTVGYFYQLVRVPDSYTDDKYGWENLDRVEVRPLRGGGYIIDFPRPILLD